jgi:hypothetical protein
VLSLNGLNDDSLAFFFLPYFYSFGWSFSAVLVLGSGSSAVGLMMISTGLMISSLLIDFFRLGGFSTS